MISIGQLLDADDIVAEIRMERQAFQGAFVLVEGVTDIRRFEKFMDTSKTSMVNCWGKSKLLDSVGKLNGAKFQGFLALADADFDRMRGTLSEHDNLIYSENHDFDIDAVRTDLFTRYLQEMAEDDLCDQVGGIASIAGQLADGLRVLSYAKYANITGLISMKLSELNWLHAFDGFQMNAERLAYLMLKKHNPDRGQIEALVKLIQGENVADVWQSTNGHDFAEATGACLRTRIAHRKSPQTLGGEVERHFRLAMSEADFRSMSLHRAILEWQGASGFTILRVHLLN